MAVAVLEMVGLQGLGRTAGDGQAADAADFRPTSSWSSAQLSIITLAASHTTLIRTTIRVSVAYYAVRMAPS